MEKTTGKHHKWKRPLVWTGAIMVSLILLAVIAGFILQHKLPDLLKASVKDKSKGLYALQFNDMQVSVLAGQITVHQVHLIPDTIAYRQMRDKPERLFTVHIEQLELKGFKVLRFLVSKKIKLTDLNVEKPVLVQWKMPVKKAKQVKEKGLRQLLQEWSGSKINHINIHDLRYRAVDWDKRAGNGGWLNHLNVAINDLWLDPATKADTNYCWMAKNIQLYGKNITYISDDELYQFRMAQLNTSTASKIIQVDSLHIVPKYTEAQWSKVLSYKRDRYQMTFPKIEVKGMRFKEFEQEGRLIVDQLAIKAPLLHIYADKGMPEHKTVATNNFPSLAFQRLKLPLTIKQIQLINGDIYYKERNPKSGKAGIVFFKQLNGQLSNVTNDPIQLKKKAWIDCRFSTYFLGQPKLTLDLRFDMQDTTGAFHYKGSLTGAPASLFNQVLEPLTLARAESGYIHAIRFDVQANRFGASVKTDMRYNDFKMALLDAKSGKLQKKGFLSLFINWLAIKNDNPPKAGEPPRLAQHYYPHAQDGTFFNLLWKAVYSGLKVNLGLPK
ncbi:hypothetical protein GCM10023231_37680 [Olivibacter ginsenosidimutans]|uniref:DUF748 domain-containing protein n=1 Tax=Olivibacter ginsenosidimutans TaxID=1176537 RepID=A0ABP9C874_9SPHI